MATLPVSECQDGDPGLLSSSLEDNWLNHCRSTTALCHRPGRCAAPRRKIQAYLKNAQNDVVPITYVWLSDDEQPVSLPWIRLSAEPMR
jgi:hypothetical protein